LLNPAKGRWEQVAGTRTSRWGKLTDDDGPFISGKKNALVEKLQERYGDKKDEAEKHVSEYVASLQSMQAG
jgi:uncharacterized protein YjbJ (UPF0337 family)